MQNKKREVKKIEKDDKVTVTTIDDKKFEDNYSPVFFQSFAHGYQSWLWDDQYLYNQNRRDALLEFCQKNNIKVIYLSIDKYIDLVEAREDKKRLIFIDKLKTFIEKAHEKNIKVEALLGAPNWFESSHFYIVKLLINKLIFGEILDENNKTLFDGVHIDIEPYRQKNFSSKRAKYFYVHYLENLKKVVEYVQKNNINFSSDFVLNIDIPYWFDNVNKEGMVFRFNGRKKNLFEHLTDILSKYDNSTITIMAYDNSAIGGNGSLNKVEGEFDYLQNKENSIGIVVGQEFTKQQEQKITFFEKKNDYIKQQLRLIDERCSKYPNYQGIALHSLSAIFERWGNIE